jgi:parvulin-like peptidyl-prolyl isomerase
MVRIAFFSLFALALAAQAQQAGPEAQKENKVIGRVGNIVYHESDFLDYLPLAYQPSQLEQIRNSPEIQMEVRKMFLERMAVASKAKKEGVDQSPDYKTKLAILGNNLLIQEFISMNASELEKLATPTEEQIKAYYEGHKDTFKVPDTASARHVLVTVRGNESETDKLTDDAAKAKIAKVLVELANGRSWQDVAKEYSDDPGSKDNGGLYENFNPAQMVPEFAEAVRTQEIGKIGQPVRTTFGYHLILVESRKLDMLQTFEEAKANAQRQLTERMRAEVWANWVNSIKTEVGFAEGEGAAAIVTTGGKK